MGGVFSGNRRPRLAKRNTTCLHEVKLTMARLYCIQRDGGPTISPQHEEWATVRLGHKEWPVLLDHTPLNFGGQRRWLVCPKCRARRQSLFIGFDGLACRKCLDLKYESQSENVRRRTYRKADKIRAKLGWPPGVLSPNGPKPPRMHQRTFEALRTELELLTSKLLVDLSEWINEAEDALGRR